MLNVLDVSKAKFGVCIDFPGHMNKKCAMKVKRHTCSDGVNLVFFWRKKIERRPVTEWM